MIIIIASDSHGRKNILNKISSFHSDASYYLHCGDLGFDDIDEYKEWIFVKGNVDKNNNDFLSIPRNRIIDLGNHKIFMTHSDLYFSTSRKETLAKNAKENGCDIVCYGHTHVADVDIIDDVLLINPGALQSSRSSECSYCVLEIDDSLHPEIILESNWNFKKNV